MITVIFYNAILFSSTFVVWLSEKMSTRAARNVILSVAFLLVFIPAAIRYDIGTDYLNYLDIYHDRWRLSLDSYKYKEPAFYYINKLLISINAHPQYLFSIFAFIFTAVTFKAYPKKNAWLLHFLFFSLLWFFSFNGIRQAVAISFCFLAVFYYLDKKYLSFFVLTLIASLFHQSAIFISFMGLLAWIPLSYKFKTKIAPFSFIIIIVFCSISMGFILGLIKELLYFIGLDQYGNYFTSSKHFAAKESGLGLGIMVKGLFSLYILANTKRLLILNKQYWLVVILNVIYVISLILASHIIIFSRMATLFVIGQVVGGYLLLKIETNKNIHRCVIGLFLLFLILYFTRIGMGNETSYANPKLNPYQTIFSI